MRVKNAIICLTTFVMMFCLPVGLMAAGKMAPTYGGIMKVVDAAEGAHPLGVPWEAGSTIDTKLMPPVIETLLREDVSGNVHPFLATRWKVNHKKKYIQFYLRKGVKFTDGTDFNAEAVKFCWDKAIEAKMASGWTKVIVVNPYVMRVYYDVFKNTYLNRAASKSVGIISPTAFKKHGVEWARENPVATGPFKLESFQRGNILKFVKNENYWEKGKPYLDGIQYPFIRDSMTQQAAMRTSDPDQRVDVLVTASGETATMMKAQGFKLLKLPVGPVCLIPDSNNPESPLAKRKVREAISYAIDREGIVKARGFGIWKPAYQIQPDIMPSYIPNLPKRMYNPEKAKRLLKEAGYPDGFKLSMNSMPGYVDRDAMVVVQRNLAAIGIDIDLNFPDTGGYMALRFKGWKNGVMSHNIRALSTFNTTFSIYFLPDYKQFPSVKRPDGLVKLIRKSLATPKPSKRLARKMERLIWKDVTLIPLYYIYEIYILRPNVHDTGYTEWGSASIYRPENAWISKE